MKRLLVFALLFLSLPLGAFAATKEAEYRLPSEVATTKSKTGLAPDSVMMPFREDDETKKTTVFQRTKQSETKATQPSEPQTAPAKRILKRSATANTTPTTKESAAKATTSTSKTKLATSTKVKLAPRPTKATTTRPRTLPTTQTKIKARTGIKPLPTPYTKHEIPVFLGAETAMHLVKTSDETVVFPLCPSISFGLGYRYRFVRNFAVMWDLDVSISLGYPVTKFYALRPNSRFATHLGAGWYSGDFELGAQFTFGANFFMDSIKGQGTLLWGLRVVAGKRFKFNDRFYVCAKAVCSFQKTPYEIIFAVQPRAEFAFTI